jgi:uncharacterized protein
MRSRIARPWATPWRRAATRALAALALMLGLAGPALARPPMWVVHGPRGVVVLFGSIHLLPPGLDWRPPALEDAVAKARELWFELPITADTDNQASALSLTRGRLPQGATLISMLTPDQADRLQRAAVKVHCSPEALAQMQPWLAEVTLSVAEDALSGASAFNGVEEQIQAITPIQTPRSAFETAKQQIGFLAGAPREDQVASLNWTLHEIEDDPSTYDRVVQEWMAADLPALQRDAIDPLKRVSPTLYDRLIAGRNRRWAATLDDRLRRPGLVVVVVGVGHLIGQDGLPSLLRAKGLRVEGP